MFYGDISVFHEWHQKSGWRDLNPRHSGPKPDALPAALHPVISINLTDKENNVNHSYTGFFTVNSSMPEQVLNTAKTIQRKFPFGKLSLNPN